MDAFRAARAGSLEEVKRLVNRSNVGARDGVGRSALHRACEGGHVAVVEYLIEIGADTSAVDNVDGATPLWAAAFHGHTRCVKLLLARGADASLQDQATNSLPVHAAAKGGHFECVGILIASHQPGVNAVNIDGRTPLHNAALHGSWECCYLLLKAGGRANTTDRNGRTALCYALLQNNREAAEALVERTNALDPKLRSHLMAVPDWVSSYSQQCASCRIICRAVLQLQKRHSPVIGANGRDILSLVARFVWFRRREYHHFYRATESTGDNDDGGNATKQKCFLQ